ncbi:23S rRNA (adenine(2030)-N(6))-methyltransferase RlmJ [Marinimicrobium sp. ABcell2]|uniref:23S rRNA (adenine(2030)-N(6))-methyltransferase RlmJ n=1 Tax=Marinimicrobium sp. ABcell2 TaxID=3069751 RepID=UPI0027B74C27|nr:23S rRNA (adenine(2030)-N(6))-methyltransferase RlmJ [Marinimicrobium sp. ABcell2]MDQ2076743.1 23S rRNA (adenine(2030)-N(6))-methyltransferase RlmJ [Marinimicrobium sp. ABcell2]
MLSYRHAYHAGNHADVLKHSVLSLVLTKLLAKPSPCVYLDTHAGAGHYALDGSLALKTGEAATGIERLLERAPDLPELATYLDLVRRQPPNQYPGSPAIAAQLLREQDRLQLLELHSTDLAELKNHLGRDRRVSIHHRDSVEGLPALLPPTPRRGLVLMDPAYELAENYAQVISCLGQSLRRWRTGVYVLWYPLLARQRDRSDWLKKQLCALQPPNLLVAELWVQAPQEEYGMHGSGLAIINAPWQLDEQLKRLLPYLSDTLAQGQGAGWNLDWPIPRA